MNATKETINLFNEDYEVADNYHGLITIKELRDYLPPMGDELYSQLRNDIKENGINDPILYYNLIGGKKLVVEGHTRLKAAIELGIPIDSIPTKHVGLEYGSMTGILYWMLKHQIQRRNLSAAQKLYLVMSHKNTISILARENLKSGGKRGKGIKPVDTAVEIANLAGVSRETAKRYMKVYEKGSPELLNEVNDGKKSIYNASNKIRTIKEKSQSTEQPYTIVENYDIGIEMLKEGRIKSLVTLKDEDTIKTFMPYQQKSFGFYILKD